MERKSERYNANWVAGSHADGPTDAGSPFHWDINMARLSNKYSHNDRLWLGSIARVLQTSPPVLQYSSYYVHRATANTTKKRGEKKGDRQFIIYSLGSRRRREKEEDGALSQLNNLSLLMINMLCCHPAIEYISSFLLYTHTHLSLH